MIDQQPTSGFPYCKWNYQLFSCVCSTISLTSVGFSPRGIFFSSNILRQVFSFFLVERFSSFPLMLKFLSWRLGKTCDIKFFSAFTGTCWDLANARVLCCCDDNHRACMWDGNWNFPIFQTHKSALTHSREKHLNFLCFFSGKLAAAPCQHIRWHFYEVNSLSSLIFNFNTSRREKHERKSSDPTKLRVETTWEGEKEFLWATRHFFSPE